MMNQITVSPVLKEDETGVTGRVTEAPSFISCQISFCNVSRRWFRVRENRWGFPALQCQSGSDRNDDLLSYASHRVYRETNILKFTQLKEEGST
jgi:hypothetical protein